MHDDSARVLLAAEGLLELGMLDRAALELDKTPVEAGTGRPGAALPDFHGRLGITVTTEVGSVLDDR